MGGVNEVLAVYLMAAKLGVPVCPHAGGVGLCEMVQHLQVIKKLMELKKLKLNVKIKIILILTRPALNRYQDLWNNFLENEGF